MFWNPIISKILMVESECSNFLWTWKITWSTTMKWDSYQKSLPRSLLAMIITLRISTESLLYLKYIQEFILLKLFEIQCVLNPYKFPWQRQNSSYLKMNTWKQVLSKVKVSVPDLEKNHYYWFSEKDTTTH